MELNTYTLNGETFVPHNGSLFSLGETVEDLTDVESNQPYLWNNTIGVFEVHIDSTVKAFDAVFTPFNYPDQQTHFVVEKTGRLGEEFTEAIKLERVVPDGYHACPNCGGVAGDGDEPVCFTCGYGTNEGVYEDR